MSSLEPSQKLVSTLPRQLLSFFKRHPPASAESWMPDPRTVKKIPQNPFRGTKNTYTLRYQEPRYSIRRQTDLYNLAGQYGVQHLLPPRAPHKETKVGPVMKTLTKWKGTKSERTKDARAADIKEKTAAARVIVKARKARTRIKKRKQRTGIVPN